MFPSSQERGVLWRFILQHSYPLTESNEATWQASAIWAAGNCHSVVVPYGLSASKGNRLIWKVVINGRQSFRKEVLTSYKGQSQTENEGRAQQISLFLQPVSTVFKPRTCCSHHFHCSSRCLEGLWEEKNKQYKYKWASPSNNRALHGYWKHMQVTCIFYVKPQRVM